MKISQNKSIFVAAISIFVVSLSVVLFFLDGQKENSSHGKTDVLSLNMHETEHSDEKEDFLSPIELYKKFLNDSSDPWFVTDSFGKFVYTSDEFCNFIQQDCEIFKDSLVFDYLNVKDLSNFMSINTQLLQNPDPILGFGPGRMLKGNGDEVMVIFQAYPILNNEDKVYSILYSVKNITKQVEELNEKEDVNEKKEEKSYPNIEYIDKNSQLLVDVISFNQD